MLLLDKLDEKAIVKYEGVDIDDSNIDEAIIALGYASTSEFKEYQVRQFNRLSTLNNKYGFSQYTSDEQGQIFQDGVIYQQLAPNPEFEVCMSCKWQKRWCDVGVVVIAIGLQTACGVLMSPLTWQQLLLVAT